MNGPDIRVTSIGESVALARLSEGAEYTQSAERRFLEHYGLNEQPFGVTPDPRFLYLGPKHQQALAALTYGTESNRGFLTLKAVQAEISGCNRSSISKYEGVPCCAHH